MIGYLFIALALICGVIKGYCGKKTGNSIVYASDSMIINVCRMVLCILIGGIIVLFSGNYETISLELNTTLPAAICGICVGAFAVSWVLSVRTGAYMLVEVFLLCGTIIPVLLCKIFFDENIGIVQWIGIAILIVAAYIMCTYNKSLKNSVKVKDILLLLLCAFSNGLSDFSQKYYVNTVENGNSAFFNLLTYVFAAIFLLIFYLIFRTKEKKQYELRTPLQIIKPIIIFVVIMAICLFLNSYFKTLAAKSLDAIKIYPINYGGSLILSMLMSTIIFKEKLNARCIIGVLFAFTALVLINVL